MNDFVDMVPEKADNVVFYTRPVVDEEATQRENRRVHKDGTYVRICNPGDPDNIVDRPIRKRDAERYPLAWQAYQNGKKDEEQVSGTWLSAWGQLSPSKVEDYRYLKILTVEHLAGVTDANLPRLGLDARKHRDMARAFLEAAKSRGPILRLEAELEEARKREAAMQQQLQSLAARLDAQDAPPAEALASTDAPKKRGRPAKAAQQ